MLLRSHGRVVAIGDNTYGQSDVPELPSEMTYTDVIKSGTRGVLMRSGGVAFTAGLNGPDQLPAAPEGTYYANTAVGPFTIVLVAAKNTDQVQV